MAQFFKNSVGSCGENYDHILEMVTTFNESLDVIYQEILQLEQQRQLDLTSWISCLTLVSLLSLLSTL